MAVIPTTRTEAETLVLANADYRSSTTTGKAEQFRVAVQYLILHQPERVSHGGRGAEEITTNIKQLQEWLEEVNEWTEAQDADHGIAFLDFTEYRT